MNLIDSVFNAMTSTNFGHFLPMGRSAATQSIYLREGEALANRLSKALKSTDSSAVVAEFLAHADRFSQRTFRRYKACLSAHLKNAKASPSVLRKLDLASSKELAKRSKKTSGKKAKTVNAPDQVLLLAALRARKGKTAQTAADYFEAGVIAGPRPIEWLGAQLSVIDKSPMDAPAGTTHSLTFVNAKRDINEVRANGISRDMYLELSANEAAVFARVIQDANLHREQWGKHYSRMRGVLRYTGKTLWPKRNKVPCFYTTRHQSQANAKASGKPLNEIAAIYGHASDNTPTQHYAHASQGDKKLYKVSPTALSLARVRNQKVTDNFRKAEQTPRPAPKGKNANS